MPIKIQDRKKIYEVDKDGKQVPVITPEVFITLTHLETGKEYLSEKEASDDVSAVSYTHLTLPTNREV